jgi:hypothetical protein
MKKLSIIIPVAIITLMATTGLALAQGRGAVDVRPTLKERVDEGPSILAQERGTVDVRPTLKERVEANRKALLNKEVTAVEQRAEAQVRVEKEAEDASERREEASARAEVKTEEAAARAANADEKRAEALEKNVLRVEAFIVRTGSRLGAAVERLEVLSLRILSRVEKFEERGADMSEVRRLLGVADTAIAEAENAVVDIAIFATNITEGLRTGETPREAFANFREAVKSSVSLIRDAHGALVDAIIAVKAGASTSDDGENSSDDEEDEDEEE